MAAQYKYDLSAFLKAMRYKNAQYYNTLPEAEQKAASPFVVMRSLTATTNAMQVFMINELVNPFVFSFSKHKELTFDLLTICTSSTGKFLKNGKPLTKKLTKMPKVQSVIMRYFGYSSIKATEAITLISNDNILAMAEELGEQVSVLKDIKKELKLRK